jgi:hypothetical protein
MTPKNALECSLIKGLLGTLKERWTLGMQGGRKRDGVRKNGDGTVTGRKRDGHGHGTNSFSSLSRFSLKKSKIPRIYRVYRD